ncbi:MAG: TPM domain-containing protein [Gemmatimonadales bacterium]|nr:TPM domain-containing protein [Gemmatimonadales bacterium]
MLHLAFALLLALPQQSGDGIQRIVPPVPTPASFVSDQANVLSDDAHALLDARIRELQAGGYGDIAVAILPDLGGYSPNEVSVAIYRAWRVGSVAEIGSARRNVGVLLLIVPKELSSTNRGECYILTGTGAEGIITDAASGTICREAIIPLLKTLNHGEALLAGVNAIAARLAADEGLAEANANGDDTSSGTSRSPLPLLLIPGGIGATFASIFGVRRWRRRRPRACPRCGLAMRRLAESEDDGHLEHGQQVEEKVKSVDYDVWACSCGERLILPYKKIFTSYSECRECHRRTAKAKRHTLRAATTSSTGSARDDFHCRACQARWEVLVTLPVISTSSSSSGGSSGGGGGSSFGGSGSTSGGGGGGSY